MMDIEESSTVSIEKLKKIEEKLHAVRNSFVKVLKHTKKRHSQNKDPNLQKYADTLNKHYSLIKRLQTKLLDISNHAQTLKLDKIERQFVLKMIRQNYYLQNNMRSLMLANKLLVEENKQTQEQDKAILLGASLIVKELEVKKAKAGEPVLLTPEFQLTNMLLDEMETSED